MKLLPLLCMALLLQHVSSAQTSEQNRSLPAFPVLKEQAQYLLNNFKIAVIKASKCQNNENYTLNSILSKFTANAFVEVSTLRTHTKTKKSAFDYFTSLKGLCKGMNYDSIDISFPPDPILDNQLIPSRFENTCSIVQPFKQKFMAFRKGHTTPVYCDVTIKKIHVEFTQRPNGSFTAKISGIEAEQTTDCLMYY